MSNECLWCDEPCQGRLCATCHAVNNITPYLCPIPGHLPTLGASCAECDSIALVAAKRKADNAPILAQLRAIRAQLVSEWAKSWPGCDHGKALVGLGLDAAIADLEG